jgi:Cu/Ag efflux protein CusF
MKSIRTLLLTGALALAFAAPVSWGSDAIAEASELIAGQVTKIDESAGKITIKHGPIKKFEMEDGMTMVFRAQDPALLKAVKPGDKVNFDAERIRGQFTVTKIEKAK